MFTEKEANDIGSPIELLNKWEEVMNIMWKFFLAYAAIEKKVKVENKSNCIYFQLDHGHNFEIGVNMYNNKYLSLFIKIVDNDEFEATINNIDQFGKEGIIKVVSEVLTYAENVSTL